MAINVKKYHWRKHIISVPKRKSAIQVTLNGAFALCEVTRLGFEPKTPTLKV